MAAIETSIRASAAVDDLYRRYVGDVYRYAYAVLGNHADAEDVTQTTFINALRALERGEEPRNPSNWLIVIAHNIVRQRWRQAAVRPTEVELVNDVPDVSDEDEVELDGLVRALQRIPPSQREALVMRELEGRTYNEIAELLGLTTSALETLLFRARRSLAEELENLVTCQSAELAISRRLDKRLSRKDSRRLDEHLAECAACARLVETQARQRRAFKGLALLPLPVGLALFKGAPTAAAASLPTIGLGTVAGDGATGVGAATATTGATSGGSAAVGGSLIGGAVAKVAAVLVAGVVVAGAAYEGARLVLDGSGSPAAATRESSVNGAFAERDAATTTGSAPSARATVHDGSVTAPSVAASYAGRASAEVEDDAASSAPEQTAEDTATGAASPAQPDGPSAPADDGPATQPEQPTAPAPTESASPTTTPTTTPTAIGKSKPKKAKKPKKKTTPVGPKAKAPKKSQAPSTTSPGPSQDAPNGNGGSSKPENAPNGNSPDAKSQPSSSPEPQSSAPAGVSTTTDTGTAAPWSDTSGGSADKQLGNDKNAKK